LISNAYFYFDIFHVDGIRIDAVASMLYLSYGKKAGEWKPNIYGGKENLEAVGFMKRLNEVVFHNFPNALMMAEESTSWPMVTKPVYVGGLGYNYKWNMGWMNDILKYFEMDSVFRKWHHNLVTFSFMYTLSENFILPLSHDEVVHGKKSLLNKMPGDYWQKFAGLRTLFAYMYIHPGKKLVFMGGEFGQFIEWDFDKELDWSLLNNDMHKKLQNYVKTLNRLYLNDTSLNELDHEYSGYDVIDANDNLHSILIIGRFSKNKSDFTIAICNFSTEVHHRYRIGVPNLGEYVEVLNSDSLDFGGSGQINYGKLTAQNIKWHNKEHSLEITIPPLGAVYIKKI
jgi:1,4-alpha-glucan branching enzyme